MWAAKSEGRFANRRRESGLSWHGRRIMGILPMPKHGLEGRDTSTSTAKMAVIRQPRHGKIPVLRGCTGARSPTIEI